MSGGLFPSAPVQADILSLTGFEVDIWGNQLDIDT